MDLYLLVALRVFKAGYASSLALEEVNQGIGKLVCHSRQEPSFVHGVIYAGVTKSSQFAHSGRSQSR